MRILSLSNSPLDPTLGSGKTVLRWTDGLGQHGHECLTLGVDSILRPPWSRRPGRRFWLALAALRETRRQVREFQPDLVEFYGSEFGLAAWYLKRRRVHPILVAHTNGLELLAAHILKPPRARVGDRLHQKLDRAAFTHIDGFVAICDLDREYLVKRGLLKPEQTAVIEPGLDEEYLQRASAPLRPRDHAIAFTGSWIARKDTALIAGVMNQLLTEDRELRFRIFGAIGAEPQIRAAFSPDVQTRIEVADKLSNAALADALARCKIFFFPSRYEGYGIALAEAMACGCAAVTTPTGLGGSLRDGVEARVCAAGDAAAFSESLRLLLHDDALPEKLAGQGRARAAAFTWPRQCESLHALYTRWLEARSTHGG